MSSVFREFGAGLSAFEAPLDARLAFIRKTYLHVAGAMTAFVGVSYVAWSAGIGQTLLAKIMSSGIVGVIVLVIGLTVAATMAQSFARSHRAPALQYTGLGLYVAVQAFLFAPIFAIVTIPELNIHPMTLPAAAGLTLLVFGGLSAWVLTTKKDFSFLGPMISVAMLVMLGVAVLSMIVGWNIGLLYAGVMCVLAAGMVLFTTSKVLHSYRTDEYVGAALQLFASIAMLFYYILMVLMQLQGGRRSSN